MMVLLLGKAFRITEPFWGKPPLPVVSPHKVPVMRNFDAFFDVILKKLSNKQLRCRWF